MNIGRWLIVIAVVGLLAGIIVTLLPGCQTVPIPPIPVPTTTTTTTTTTLAPATTTTTTSSTTTTTVKPAPDVLIRLPHGAARNAPDSDLTNEDGARFTASGINDLRLLVLHPDRFLKVPDGVIHPHRNADGSITVGYDDFYSKTDSGVVYCFYSTRARSDSNPDLKQNPVTLSGDDWHQTTRARWQAFRK